jgi:phosphopantothenoylcysteine decarboxylase/phosphopantothenate--cysteine ligase
MGFAIARAAREAGAEVTLVAGPVHLPTPRGVRRIDVQSARDMLAATLPERRSGRCVCGHCRGGRLAARQHPNQKIKKDGSGQVPEAAVHRKPRHPGHRRAIERGPSGKLFCVGFAAESHDLVNNAQAKRARKGVPLLVGNIGPATFGRTTTHCCWWMPHGRP